MDEYRDHGRPVRVFDPTRPAGEDREGVVWRTLVSSFGEPVYEVRFDGDDFERRVPSRETLVFLDSGEVVDGRQ
jgi:hypothetical protein